jgi:beta-N-acetylhexosaminidase
MKAASQVSASPVGKLFIIGFAGTDLSPELASLLVRMQPAGVILFARNIVQAQQTHKLLEDCRTRVSEPLFTCVDLEGGRVDRFRGVIGAAPAAPDVFATGERKLFRKHGEIIGKSCRALGFNVDLAPVLDLAFPASRRVMSSRSVSIDPKEVVLYAREFLGGLQAQGVIGAGKHFPGLGEGKLDSHHHLPVIKKTFDRLWQEDLVPYRILKRELPMVLVNHASYPSITRGSSPASLSKKWITDVLRRSLGYRGLILSDDLEMGGVLKVASIGEAAVEFVRAGGDLCLVCHEREHVENAFETMVHEYERKPKFRKRVAESARRVTDFKRKQKLARPRPAPSAEMIGQLSRRLWEFSEQIRFKQLSYATRSLEPR